MSDNVGYYLLGMTKNIGHSTYQICNTAGAALSGRWFIRERYNDKCGYARVSGYYTESLKDIVDVFNGIDSERCLTKYESLILSPMSYESAYAYYMQLYNNGIYLLDDLRTRYNDSEKTRNLWYSRRNESAASARDYESFCNEQRALYAVIGEVFHSTAEGANV